MPFPGNYGLSVAHAARALGIRATVCLPDLAPDNRAEDIARMGCTVRVCPMERLSEAVGKESQEKRFTA